MNVIRQQSTVQYIHFLIIEAMQVFNNTQILKEPNPTKLNCPMSKYLQKVLTPSKYLGSPSLSWWCPCCASF